MYKFVQENLQERVMSFRRHIIHSRFAVNALKIKISIHFLTKPVFVLMFKKENAKRALITVKTRVKLMYKIG